MNESMFIASKLMILGTIGIALLGAVAFAIYWFVGRREDD